MNKNQHDISKVFLMYMTLVGDAEKVATALDMQPDEVRELAKAEGWVEKVKSLSLLSKSEKPGDWERAQNRALNFVQCHQMRRVLDACISALAAKAVDDPLSVLEYTNPRTGQTTYTAKVFMDLSRSMDNIHALTYAALGDTVPERKISEEKGEENPAKAAGLHAAIIGALNHASLTHSTAEQLAREAEAKARQLTLPSKAEG